jgi:hypothetical protein
MKSESAQSERTPLLMTRTASFVAVGVVVGMALAAVPNVELVTAVCFSAGFLLGSAAGGLTGCLTELIFAGFHPMGGSWGPLLLAQIIGMSLAGVLGGLASNLTKDSDRFRFSVIVVGFGLAATLIFDLLTNLAFPFAAGFSVAVISAYLAAALLFVVIHLGSNLLVFSIIVVPLLPRLKKILDKS